jgi:hypothetical protein
MQNISSFGLNKTSVNELPLSVLERRVMELTMKYSIPLPNSIWRKQSRNIKLRKSFLLCITVVKKFHEEEVFHSR